MNILVGVNVAYLSFVPNAGNSLMFSIIAITLYAVLSVISLGLYYSVRTNHDDKDKKMLRDLSITVV